MTKAALLKELEQLSSRERLELAYGIGQLDRFGVVGTTQFFQARLQFQF